MRYQEDTKNRPSQTHQFLVAYLEENAKVNENAISLFSKVELTTRRHQSGLT
jgi:hypothetical protein